MKKFLRISGVAAAILAAPVLAYAALYAAVHGIPFVYMLFFGNHYLYAGDAVMIRGGRISRLAVYRARGKPFLPVDPCRSGTPPFAPSAGIFSSSVPEKSFTALMTRAETPGIASALS